MHSVETERSTASSLESQAIEPRRRTLLAQARTAALATLLLLTGTQAGGPRGPKS